jgi:hypothetical protein
MRESVVAQLLGRVPSTLESGRVPVLVCEECGDIGCGAVAVRILHEEGCVRWTDWSYENGYEPAKPLEWPTQPGDFVFERNAYEAALRGAQEVDARV